MLKLIGKVRILGMQYKVLKGYSTPIGDLYGQISAIDKEIRINEKACVTREQEEETFLHEVIHAVSDTLKLEFDETTVARLSVGLYASGVKAKMEKHNG